MLRECWRHKICERDERGHFEGAVRQVGGERREGGPHSEARGKNCTSTELEDFNANQTEQTATRERRTKGTASAELHGGSVGSESGSGKKGRST